MSQSDLPGREDVLAMLATYGDRTPGEVGDQLDSLALTWLIAQAEQRYGIELDLSDDVFTQMSTVDGAVLALRGAIGDARQHSGHGAG